MWIRDSYIQGQPTVLLQIVDAEDKVGSLQKSIHLYNIILSRLCLAAIRTRTSWLDDWFQNWPDIWCTESRWFEGSPSRERAGPAQTCITCTITVNVQHRAYVACNLRTCAVCRLHGAKYAVCRLHGAKYAVCRLHGAKYAVCRLHGTQSADCMVTVQTKDPSKTCDSFWQWLLFVFLLVIGGNNDKFVCTEWTVVVTN